MIDQTQRHAIDLLQHTRLKGRRRMADQPAIETGHTVDMPGNQANIVRNDKDAHPRAQLRQAGEQVLLGACVDACRRFIEDQQLGFGRQRPCQQRALQLPP